jgi:TetR/AcrR family transcriptional regulator
MKQDSQIRQEQIVEAALRRFSHFGIGKTTVTEVADDLFVTKQALSYYFPDKQQLVKAVIEKVTMDYLGRLEEEMKKAGTVEVALLKLTEVKSLFFEKHFMLVLQADHFELANSSSLHKWKEALTEKETALITELFHKGISLGELKPMDAEKTAHLFLETLYAFSRCIKDMGALPGREVFRNIFLKQQEVIRLFYAGLKAATWQR